MIFNISEAKANFSKLIEMAYHGEEIIIAKNNLPLVDLVIHQPRKKRVLGLLAGKITIPNDFLNESDDVNALFYGD
ncbi:MAG: type II toxin-antitoxin system Phd/YefM family antitoxin [Methylophagaceae bacterium]